MAFDQILQTLQEAYKQEEGDPENHIYRFLCPGDVVLTLEEEQDKGMVYLYTAVAKVPSDDQAAIKVFRRLLSANLFHMSSGKGTLALDEESGLLVYFETVLIEDLPSSQSTLDVTDLFIRYASFWVKELESLAREKQTAVNRKQLLARDLQLASRHKLNIIMP